MAVERENPEKAAEIEAIASKVRHAAVVGIVDIAGIPASQMQRMRTKLRGKAELRVAKNTLIRIALERVGGERKGLTGLVEGLGGQAAVVTTDLNPFKLFKELEGTKAPAPAKGGEVAPADIWVREGDTPFKPGPVVSELQKAGIPAAIEKGKVVVKKDKLLVQGGKKIPREVAGALTRLEIFPLIVGLDLRLAFEEGQVFGRDVLRVDDALVRAQVLDAAASALNLAVFIAYPTAQSTPLLLADAHRKALALAVEADIPTKGSLPLLLSKANAQALALSALIPAAPTPPEDAKGGEGDVKEETVG